MSPAFSGAYDLVISGTIRSSNDNRYRDGGSHSSASVGRYPVQKYVRHRLQNQTFANLEKISRIVKERFTHEESSRMTAREHRARADASLQWIPTIRKRHQFVYRDDKPAKFAGSYIRIQHQLAIIGRWFSEKGREFNIYRCHIIPFLAYENR